MRKAIFNNRFGDTITTDEILAPVHICGQLSCAIDEDVDNSDDIEDDDTKPERPSSGIAEISAEDGFVKVEAKNDGEEYHEIAANSIRDSKNGEAIYDSYRFTWPEGEFAVSGQSYEYTKDELNNVRFDSGHEER